MTHLTFLYFPATTQSRPRDPPLCQWFRGGHGIAVPPRMSTQGVSTEGTTEPCRSPLPAPRPRPQPRGLRGADSPACTQPGALGQPCPLFTSIRYVRTCRSGCIQALVSPAGDTSPCTVTPGVPVAPHLWPGPDLPAVRAHAVRLPLPGPPHRAATSPSSLACDSESFLTAGTWTLGHWPGDAGGLVGSELLLVRGRTEPHTQ